MKDSLLQRPSLCAWLAIAMILSLTLAGLQSQVEAWSGPAVPQKLKGNGDKGKGEKGGKKGKKKKSLTAPTEPGTPTLWQDRGNISQLDLFLGIGSTEGLPKPPFQFDKEDLSGSNPKVKVVDANGVKWNLKFDEEVHAEIAATRLVWACGYMVEESYFVAAGKVLGVTELKRAKDFIGPDGSFTNGLFEKRPENIARRGVNWSWKSNPFEGSRELSGLAILNCMLNNWDAKEDNNNILGMYDDDGAILDWYTVTDWGGTFGKLGGFTSRSKNKWNLEDFSKHGMIEDVKSKTVKFRYAGKMDGALRSIPHDHVRWFYGIIGGLTDRQIAQAFRAAGGTSEEINGFTKQIRKRINELKAAVE
jgi:hypothetical protein